MRRLRVGDSEVEDSSGDISERLAEAFARREHPLCLCQPDGVPMYVVRAGGRHVLKRMPGSGPRHDPDCDSYEPPHALSGLGAVAGEAIVENARTASPCSSSISACRSRPVGRRRRRARRSMPAR
nr:DUF1173 family protein [Xanthobacter dioxanivorans]